MKYFEIIILFSVFLLAGRYFAQPAGQQYLYLRDGKVVLDYPDFTFDPELKWDAVQAGNIPFEYSSDYYPTYLDMNEAKQAVFDAINTWEAADPTFNFNEINDIVPHIGFDPLPI